MATEKQIVANRQNATQSTGPKTEHGKRRSRRNATRHGLTAETVLDIHEDPRAYRALARAISADYRPRTNFELELVARLVSLLWRLRRAVAIESGLVSIHAHKLHKRKAKGASNSEQLDKNRLSVFYRLIPPASGGQIGDELNGNIKSPQSEHSAHPKIGSDIVRAFMQVADSDAFERLGRYEMSLWRQTVQIILLLNSINHSANDQYAACDDKSLYLRNVPRKRRGVQWPPFPTFA
jgi:hypothetical protein